ncbi:MAG: hypothetical protein CFK52_01285 [Chloracidobacterium sp. CP2_5A]|nr:MAG: hypothetical protein CFK52_01285 [Chloracidobacterium sp. CP2_5A]
MASRMILPGRTGRAGGQAARRPPGRGRAVKFLTGFDKGVNFRSLSASYSKPTPVLAVKGEKRLMRRKVLLADDSLSIQKMFGLYLEKCEIDVVTMSNGEMAVSRLSAIQPDLVLADVFMPGRTGYEVCEYVKQHPDFKHIPVLLLTGKFEPYDEKEAKRVKADGHIVKPIAEQEFVSLVRATLERAAPKPAAPPAFVMQTQAFGSVPPPAATKEPSASSLPRFHFGGPPPDPLPEAPPPTIKVSPSMLDDGRLPDLDPLLPLDAPPPAAADAPDFILDLPPADQAPPVLSYPEPPKTLSMPIQRPTFSQMSPPDFGTTTAKLDPSELPELLAAPPPAAPVAVEPVAVDMESPLELEDMPLPAAATPLANKLVAALTPPTVAPEVAEAPPLVAPEETAVTATQAAADEPPVAAEVAAAEVAATEVSAAEPEAIAPPEPPAPPITAALEAQAETSSLSPVTAPLEAAPTGDLRNEPIPPPDFLSGLVSPPPATEPPPSASESAPQPGLESQPPLAMVADAPKPPPAPPTFEVVMEDEPPTRGTDLLPDELRAIRERQREAIADAPALSVSEADAPPVPVEVAVVSPGEPADGGEAETPTTDFAPATPEEAAAPLFTPAPLPAAAPVNLSAPTETSAKLIPETPVSLADRLPDASPPANLTAVADVNAPAFAPAPLEATTLPPFAPIAETPAGEAEATTARAAYEGSEDLTQPIPSAAETSPVAEAAADPSPPLADWSSFTLPPALVDDIVRRVVAEMSDRVVREIAWEVVPDLAELIIKKRLANGNGHRGPNA